MERLVRALVYVGAALVLLHAAGVASAHQREYVNGIGDFLVVCDSGEGKGLSYGGFCYAPGHVVPNEAGEMTLYIDDVLIRPVSGVFCQDLDWDGFCDTSSVAFCGSATFRQGMNWDPYGSIMVFIDGPIFGKPFLSACESFATGLAGTGDHS